jgi:DNA repair exonuclease SbcCD ATPase subunit
VILRGIHIEHWRCIGKLDLDALSPGVNVLSGPNRTGKSSLAAAVRACLFDYDHNTRSLDACRPWNSDESPRIVIEFATGGEEYQLTKVYSTRKDGKATLQKRVGNAWCVVHNDPKEASRKTRELLGADKSDAGLNQLLWLDQGSIALPDPKKLDSSLQQQLLQVLGVLITGRDQEFKDALDKRWSQWFTPNTRNYKKNSEVPRLEQLREQRQAALDEEERKYREVEEDIRTQQAKLDERPGLEVQVKDAEEEVRRLDQERQSTEERRRNFAEAQRIVVAAEKEFETVSRNWKNLIDAKDRHEKAAEAANQWAEKARTAEQEVTGRFGARHAADQHVLEVKQAGQALQREQEELADYRQLGSLSQQQARLEKDGDKARELEAEEKRLEDRVGQSAAPSEAQLSEWRTNRNNATTLRARLEAAALNLTVRLERPTRIDLSVDGAGPQSVELPGGETCTYSLRQRIGLEIPGVGRIEAARTQADQSLEEDTRQLTRLDQEFVASMRSYQEDPADAGCLEHLTERRLQRETDLDRLKKLRKELGILAPDGIAVLQGLLDDVLRQKGVILERRPLFGDGLFDAAEAERRELFLQEQTGRWKKMVADAEAAAKNAQRTFEEANATAGKLSNEHAGAKATEKSAREELQRLGDESALRAKRQAAEVAVGAAKQTLAAAALTPEEQTIGERCENSKNALQQREDRLRKLDEELIRLRGKLEGSEGLHTRRTDAALALQAATTQLERETREATAHKHLRELFDQCREYQVQRVVGPISDRVLEWARHLGLNDYREVRFGDQFLPEGFFPQNGAMETPIALCDESYGTVEQLALLVRLALGGVLAVEEPQVAILDDPLTHADTGKHRRFLEILKMAAEAQVAADPPAGRLQILILTCHPDRFDHLPGAMQINLAERISREG